MHDIGLYRIHEDSHAFDRFVHVYKIHDNNIKKKKERNNKWEKERERVYASFFFFNNNFIISVVSVPFCLRVFF